MHETRRPAAWLILVVAGLCSLVGTAVRATPVQQEPTIPTPLTLERALDIFVDRNPVILAERQQVAAARADRVHANRLPNPTFAYEAESVGGSAIPDSSFWDDQDLNVMIEQRIPIGGRRAKLTAAADQALLAAQSTLQDTVRRLTLELKSRYYAVVLAEQELELATEVLAQFGQIVGLMERRYEQGEASGLELARLRTERLRFFNDQVSAEAGVANAKVALLELLGARSVNVDFQVEEELVFERERADIATLEAAALDNRPDLAAHRSQVERAYRLQDYERSLRVPDLVPYLGYNRDFGQDNLTFGVAMEVPILYRNQGGIARAVAETGREQALLYSRELLVRREVRQAFNLVVAEARLVAAMEAEYVPSAEQARDIAQASYRLGALDLIAFLDAERAYRETLRGYYQALYDHQVTRFILDAVVGEGGR